jgi:two-component system, NarL family, sensor kinase
MKNSLLIFVLLIVFILLILVLFIGFLIFLYQKKQNQHKQKISNLKIIHENDKLKTQIQVQEATFQFISREIHDNIGQKISLAKLHLNTLSESENDILQSIIQILTDSLNDLRDLSRSMSSEFISNNGFIKAIENEIQQLSKIERYNFKLTITGNPVFFNSEKDVILFRIVQESLANIIKHAEATQIHFNLHYTQNYMQIEVNDNGVGFIPSEKSDSNGIKNITSRAKLMDGFAEFISVPSKGTTVKVKIPIYDNE